MLCLNVKKLLEHEEINPSAPHKTNFFVSFVWTKLAQKTFPLAGKRQLS